MPANSPSANQLACSAFLASALMFASTAAVLAQPGLRPTPPTAGPQAAGRQAGDPQNAAPRPSAPQVAMPQPPSWWPLPAEEQKWVDQVLDFWSVKSRGIHHYRCDFQRFEYDATFGPRNRPRTWSTGKLRYAAPDKGLFNVERRFVFVPEADQGQGPRDPDRGDYVEQPEDQLEQWICDGKSIIEFNYLTKEVRVYELPPELRGQQIVHSPLPFLFGATAENINRRYWVRNVTTEEEQAEGKYRLEAYPKSPDDAANYRMVHVILDSDFVPEGLILFDRNYQPDLPNRTTFVFENREVNFSILGEQLRVWERSFFEPRTPSGWRRVELRLDELGAAPGPAQPQVPQASRQGPAAPR